MKKNHKFKVIIATFAMAVGLGSCSDDDPMPENNSKTIVQLVSEDPDFSLLRTAVVRAGLVETLSASGDFTVFAPTNAAFIAAGFTTDASINAVEVNTLKSILMYHVLGSRVMSNSIPTATNTAVETSTELSVYVTKSNTGVSVNGAKVIQADVMAQNGVIHAIDKVMLPPMGNIVEVAQDNANFSLLVAAVLRASEGSVNVAQVLQGAGPMTVFAPTNQAFINAGFANEAAIMAALPATLTSILTTHVIPSRIYSTMLTEGYTLETVAENNLTFSLQSGATVKGPGNSSASNITSTDMTVDNGVIHVIDQVLLP
ncbi:fasciclin domain-containing protein [Sphingobacterium alkalisoli]|uniref:Fasciclin domain-containing protein n=1 Tax=Sphingobacterium alkalisoli TaxID=1874115 RepID=A0A4U0H6W2_9SPHI|nr:fasciclin domain-containing protein [Sphingobacterium alkalisoli]TJY67054.1 fasciclin domain-containing protein [Sphingobacterium alkalisoli]GGH12516.1 beta-Ig-H3/fasciclin domain-containing protein [Sphingobacterium alkalisoli]